MSGKNLKVLRHIRIAGKHIEAGSVIAKSDFESKGDWMDLCQMKPARLEETDEKLGLVSATKTGKTTKAAMPGA